MAFVLARVDLDDSVTRQGVGHGQGVGVAGGDPGPGSGELAAPGQVEEAVALVLDLVVLDAGAELVASVAVCECDCFVVNDGLVGPDIVLQVVIQQTWQRRPNDQDDLGARSKPATAGCTIDPIVIARLASGSQVRRIEPSAAHSPGHDVVAVSGDGGAARSSQLADAAIADEHRQPHPAPSGVTVGRLDHCQGWMQP